MARKIQLLSAVLCVIACCASCGGPNALPSPTSAGLTPSNQPVITLAIAARTEKDFIDNPIPPCGACRQVILETEKRYGQPIRILLYGKECIYEIKSIGDLLPLSFDASAMED